MIVVVGGGISGLATAWYLKQAGHACTLIEKRPRLGGVIETNRFEDCVLEAGPDSFLAIKPEATQLARELGIEDQIISSNDHQRVTYIWKRRQLMPMPDGLMMMVPTKLMPVAMTPLLSWSTKIRMGLEYFRRPTEETTERSVADFVSEHYGDEAVDYLAEPLLSGVYGGDPKALSVSAVLPRFVTMEQKYGSLTRGVLAARKQMPNAGPLFNSFKGGLGQLTGTLTNQLQDSMRVIHGEVESIEPGYRLRVNREWIEAKHVVLATPAYGAAALLRPFDTELARLLDTVDYNSSMTIVLAYRPGKTTHSYPGFGFLVPKKERRFLRAATWVHRKFPHRAPEGYSIVRGFASGDAPDDVAVRETLTDLRIMMALDAEPDYVKVAKWPRAMAQYTLGHAYRIRQIQARLSALKGLFLAGNAYNGIGIPDCIQTGKQAAGRIAKGAD